MAFADDKNFRSEVYELGDETSDSPARVRGLPTQTQSRPRVLRVTLVRNHTV